MAPLSGDNKLKKGCFTIDDFLVDTGDNTVIFAEQRVHIEPKAMSVLYHLALNAGDTISRQELLATVWGDRVVVEEALTRTISQIRAALNDNKSRKLIQTISKKGYRLNAKVGWDKVDSPLGIPDKPIKESRSLKLGLAVVASLLFMMVIWFGATFTPEPEAITENKNASVAVLPLKNLSGEQDILYLAQGIPEEILSKLSGYDGLQVSSRYSSFAEVNQQLSLEQIAEKLGVSHLLEGSVRKIETEYRVVVRLIDTQQDNAIWSHSYQVDEQQLFAVQDDIVKHVVQILVPRREVSSNTERVTQTTNFNAYQHYLRGTYWWMNGKTSEWFYRAETAFLAATEADPDFASAYGSLAYIYARHDYHDVYMSSKIAIPKAKNAIDKALTLASEEENALLATAILATSSGRFNEAESALQNVLTRIPGNATALYLKSELALAQNDFADALRFGQDAVASDPMSPWVNVNLAVVHFWRGELGFALSSIEKAIAIDNQYTWAYVWQAKILLHKGQPASAIEVMLNCMEIDKSSPSNALFLALLYLELDMLSDAQHWFEYAASLFGDSADARFWQGFIRFFYHQQDTDVALNLVNNISRIENPFVSIFQPLQVLVMKQGAVFTNLQQQQAIELPVNHRDYHQANYRVLLENMQNDGQIAVSLQQFISQSSPAKQSVLGVSILNDIISNQLNDAAMDNAAQIPWLLNSWLFMNPTVQNRLKMSTQGKQFLKRLNDKQALQRSKLL